MKGRVARHQADRTNQKLYFTRIYCQLAEQQTDNQLQQAHIESAITHLYGAYLAFLQEIASFYNLALQQPTLASIEDSLQSRTQISPEIQRIKRVVEEDFLAEIYKAWQQVLYKPIPNFNTTSETANKLPIIDVMAQRQQIAMGNVSTDLVRQWREDLMNLIESLREGMIEY